MSEFNLFVYGTLRADGIAAACLAGCVHLGDAAITGTLYDIDGRFPALVRYGTDEVRGELWRCPADLLVPLDAYEGIASGMFRRIATEAETATGQILPCWVYAAGPALSRKLTPDRRIASRRWDPAAAMDAGGASVPSDSIIFTDPEQ